jgi:hypothetical protein
MNITADIVYPNTKPTASGRKAALFNNFDPSAVPTASAERWRQNTTAIAGEPAHVWLWYQTGSTRHASGMTATETHPTAP